MRTDSSARLNDRRLGRFIDSMKADGRLDSEGVFTLCQRKTLAKLGHFFLPPDGSWILKLVQSACRAQAEYLKVKAGRRYLHIELCTRQALPTHHWQNGLTEVNLEVNPAINSFCEGLRSVVFGENRDAFLTVRSGSSQIAFKVSVDGVDQASEELVQPHKGTRIYVRVPVDPRDSGKELDKLVRRARTSPVPLWINSKRHDDLFVPHLEHQTSHLGVSWLRRNDKGRPLGIPAGVRAGVSTRSPICSAGFALGDGAARLASVHYHYWDTDQIAESSSRLHLVSDGVIVGTETIADLDGSITVDLFEPCDYCDMTGLSANWSRLEGRALKARKTLSAFNPQFAELARALQRYPVSRGDSLFASLQRCLRWYGGQRRRLQTASAAISRFQHRLPFRVG